MCVTVPAFCNFRVFPCVFVCAYESDTLFVEIGGGMGRKGKKKKRKRTGESGTTRFKLLAAHCSYCSILQHIAAHLSTLHCAAGCCFALQHTAAHHITPQLKPKYTAPHCTHCTTLQLTSLTAAHHITLHFITQHCNVLMLTAQHFSTLHYTVVHRTTL